MSGQSEASSCPKTIAPMDDDELGAVLLARRPAPATSSVSGLDGYLTALVIGPRFIDPQLWIPLFAGEKALFAGEESDAFRLVQSLVAHYNRISLCLSDFPASFRPRFEQRSSGTWDGVLWMGGFLTATSFAPRLWSPVISGHESTGDIIAPIRSLASTLHATDADFKAVGTAVVGIRKHFMPRRAKAAKRR